MTDGQAKRQGPAPTAPQTFSPGDSSLSGKTTLHGKGSVGRIRGRTCRGLRHLGSEGSCRASSRFFHSGDKYCRNGGMALAYHHDDAASRGEVPGRGVRDRHRGPLSWSPGSGPFAGEKAWGSMIRARWGPGWTRLPFFFCRRKKYCHIGGMALAAQCGAWPGAKKVRDSPSWPLVVPRKCPFAGEKIRGRDSRPLGAAIRPSASSGSGAGSRSGSSSLDAGGSLSARPAA